MTGVIANDFGDEESDIVDQKSDGQNHDQSGEEFLDEFDYDECLEVFSMRSLFFVLICQGQ